MIEAKIIADTVSATHGGRITTMQLKYQRFIHSEFMTHRAFSRNASSSRAIPTAKLIEQVRNNPAMPIHWGQNQAGMQANGQLSGSALVDAQAVWKTAAENAATNAESMLFYGLHKQVANRILEPFQWMHVVVTTTEWENFFDLRCHPDAQPEIQALACAMREALDASEPTRSLTHLPYLTEGELVEVKRVPIDWSGQFGVFFKISAARCARVSYLKHDGQQPSVEDDLKLFQRLAGGQPIHASPLEHQAVAGMLDEPCRNFRGWRQFRVILESNPNSIGAPYE